MPAIPYPTTTNTYQSTGYDYGTSGNDRVLTDTIANTVLGSGDGDDYITLSGWNLLADAGAGNDVIVYQSTSISVTGGAGSDYFVFDSDAYAALAAWDNFAGRIYDFQNGVDKIAIINTSITDFSAIQSSIVQIGAHTQFTFEGRNVTLENFIAAQLDASDFVFASDDGSGGGTPPSGNEVTVSNIAQLRAALADVNVDIINVTPGTYTVTDNNSGYFYEQAGLYVSHDVVIRSAVPGQLATFEAGTAHYKGLFVVGVGVNATFDGIGFENTRDFDGGQYNANFAGIRHNGENLTVLNSHFENNFNAIKVDNPPLQNATLTIRNTDFVSNGDQQGDGQEHHIYFEGQWIDIEDSTFTDSGYGHAVKTVAHDYVRIVNNEFYDLGSAANHSVNLEGGGDLIATGNYISKGAASQNPYVFYIETIRNGGNAGSITISNNTIDSQYTANGGALLLGNVTDVVAQISNNILTGSFNADAMVNGIASFTNTTLNGATVSQTWSNSVEQGTAGADSVFMDGGFSSGYVSYDVIGYNGLGGDDILVADSLRQGAEAFFGGDGNDILSGGQSSDFLYGENGDDIIFAGGGFTWAFGGAGNDWIVSGPDGIAGSINYLSGGDGNDILDGRGTDFSVRLDGGADNDLLIGTNGGDDFNGGDGDDIVYGGQGIERYYYGGDGIDTAVYNGNYAADGSADYSIFFEYGINLVIESTSVVGEAEVGAYWETPQQFEFIQFSNGVYDVVNQTFTAGVVRPGASLSAILATPYPTHPIEGSSPTGQTITGTNAADTLTGGAGNDVIIGLAGNDTMNGGDGNDVFQVTGTGHGYDLITGGAGNDTLLAMAVNTRFYLNGISGVETFDAGGFTGVAMYLSNSSTAGDVYNFYGSSFVGFNKIYTQNGNDVITLNEQANWLNLGAGNDTAYGEAGDDYIYGNNGNDTMFGGDGLDRLFGDNNDDTLHGNAGNDVLQGGAGNDILIGGAGLDTMTGGTGADIFRFDDGEFGGATTSTGDRITDFNKTELDKIDLSLVDAINGGGDNAFSFIGTSAFGNVAGQLRYQQIGSYTYVQGDTDGNGAADFMLRLNGTVNLINADFVL